MRDEESNAGTDTWLDYFNARYMWASLGRFTAADPDDLGSIKSAPQSWKLYGYVRNNPLRFVDRTGRRATITTSCRQIDGHDVCNLNIEATVAIYTNDNSGMSNKDLNKAEKDLKADTEQAWKGSFVHEGKLYKGSTTINVVVAGGKTEAINSGADNVVAMTQGDAKKGISSFVVDRSESPFSSFDRGEFSFNAITQPGRHTGAHELGHFFHGRDFFTGYAVMNKDPNKSSPVMTSLDLNEVIRPVVSLGTGTRTVRALWSARLGF
jgi:RHS repeat-associated protein